MINLIIEIKVDCNLWKYKKIIDDNNNNKFIHFCDID